IFTLISRSNRFMVGDIKQSIYGFRGAEPSVFADYRRRLPLYPDDLNGSSEGSTVFMSENFRCDEPVIDFTNLVCSFAFRVCPGMEYKKEDDLIFAKGNKTGRLPDKVHIALVNRPAPSQSKEADSPDEDDEPRGEPAWVAQKICELLKTCKKEDGETLKPSDIAILMRSSSQFRKFSDALRQAGIPVQSPKSDSPGDDPEMILLMRTLELIDNPQNDIALESVLSSLFGFTLEQLIAIRHAAGSAYSLSGALHRASEEEGPLAESCKTFLAWLDRWQKDSIAMPADLFIRLLWRDERLADIASGDAAATIYDYARSYQAVAYNGLYGFLNYFKRLLEDEKNLRLTTSAAENATGVSIRTIHDAKGLEFPVVFICCTHQGFNTDDLKKDLICHEQLGLTMKLFSPDDLVRHDNLIRLSASIPVSYKLIEEEIRIMYVALTRAREHLYVTATVTKDGASILDDAAWIRSGCRYDILHAKNMLTWIMAAKNADPATFAKCADLSVIDPAMIKKAAYLPDPGEETAESGPASDETDARYRSVLEKAGTYSYPYAYLEGIPPFVNASSASNDC
ncbi:MAG: UvrD-helicase domain-containing protein, partial [Clostridia bacterium]|nr:UvrD-helicase domain-containing protein [Clostridia bacterium]